MNYSNSAQRIRPPKTDRHADVETVLSIETDKRGTHLRVRKVTTLARRALRPLGLAAVVALMTSAASAATFIIEPNGVDSPFQVSFRDLGFADANNTTFFGWTGNNTGGSGADALDDFGFDGSATPGPPNNLQSDDRIFNPPVIVGAGGIDGSISQVEDIDILANSNNIFAGNAITGESISANLTLQIPTNGVVGPGGFTTIIIQGVGSITNTGTNVFPELGAINGVMPAFAVGVNRGPQLQWWAKYEIPGNEASYSVNIFLPGGTAGLNPVSIRELVVDTQFSTVGYADDIAFVPEPSSFAALLGGVGMLAMRRRRSVA